MVNSLVVLFLMVVFPLKLIQSARLPPLPNTLRVGRVLDEGQKIVDAIRQGDKVEKVVIADE